MIKDKEERVIKWLEEREIEFESSEHEGLLIVDKEDDEKNQEGHYDDWVVCDGTDVKVLSNHEFLAKYKEYKGVL